MAEKNIFEQNQCNTTASKSNFKAKTRKIKQK